MSIKFAKSAGLAIKSEKSVESAMAKKETKKEKTRGKAVNLILFATII